MKSLLKKILPKKIRDLRHLLYAWLGNLRYRSPSKEMLVVGITGTSGKSSTVYLLRQVLESADFVVGSLSTIDFYVAGENKLNDQKMTMLGKMQIQKYLREMSDAGCQVVLLEMTSEGRVQHRHRFIATDIMALTNFYPEHIESHGSFERYKQAKLDLFSHAASYAAGEKKTKEMKAKQLPFETTHVPKIAVVNGDIEHTEEFLHAGNFDQSLTFGKNTGVDMQITGQKVGKDGIAFSLQNTTYDAPLYGEHNIQNLAAVLTIAQALGVSESDCQKALKTLQPIPGRIEFIEEAEKKGFQAIVDYAFEPKAMAALYNVVSLLNPNRIIHVFGQTGGGRDTEKRAVLGMFVGERADICIVTDEDPYDDDPKAIIDEVADAVSKTGKKDGETLLRVLDRKEAIQKAVSLAKKGDLILVTGKGSEQAMCIAHNRKIPWDDRQIVRDAIAHM